MAWADSIWAQRFDTASKWMAVATGFAIPMPTVWPSYTMGLFLLFWLLAGNFREKGRAVLRNSVALWALALFALLTLGVLYSAASTGDALSALNKYRKLYYIPLLVTVLDDPRWARRA